MLNRPLVIYHADCHDGFCCAWLLKKTFPGAKFVPAKYGDDPPEDLDGRDVFIVDFSYKRDTLIEVCHQANSVVLLDHHNTTREEWIDKYAPPVPENCWFKVDLSKSGARLVWEHICDHLAPWRKGDMSRYGNHRISPHSLMYLYPFTPCPSKKCPPWFVEYTEDRDLWKWELPYSGEINAYIRSYPMEFAQWDLHIANIEPKSPYWKSVIRKGEAILRHNRIVVQDHCNRAEEIEIAGYKVLAVNATVLQSEIAGKLSLGRPFGACYVDNIDGTRTWSLRSRGGGGIDVSEVAKKMGGGGHRNAAGFTETPR